MSRNKVVIEESVVRIITVGIQGPPGLQGVQGEPGPAGGAIAPGGSAGEFLKKANDNENGTTWAAIEESDVAGLVPDLVRRV
jgi:hypothetical protein